MSLYPTILLVDDDLDDREIFMEALKLVDVSIRPLTAVNGPSALKLLQNDIIEKPDIIFLDMNMPVMNGKQLLAEIKSSEDLRRIPVIMYSTFFSETDLRDTKKLGVAHHLFKPSKFDELVSSLKQALSRQW